jgi:DNA-3-methyladenine glycosylase
MRKAIRSSGNGMITTKRLPIDSKGQKRLSRDFFTRDVLSVAPELLGKTLAVRADSEIKRFVITETEAYRGTEDKACHAFKGRTARTEVMFREGGRIYVYLVYGMYWMLNFVTGNEGDPQAVLIRSVEGITGPGRLTRNLGIDGSFYAENLEVSERIWIEDSDEQTDFSSGPRIGIDYAGEPWKNMPWRYCRTEL